LLCNSKYCITRELSYDFPRTGISYLNDKTFGCLVNREIKASRYLFYRLISAGICPVPLSIDSYLKNFLFYCRLDHIAVLSRSLVTYLHATVFLVLGIAYTLGSRVGMFEWIFSIANFLLAFLLKALVDFCGGARR